MKRFFALALALALLLLPVSALANSWGLKGALLSAVMADHTWDDYHANGDQVGNVAVMTSRYHNALMLVMDKESPLEVYTRAVWQPDDARGNAKLARSGDGFTLSYSKVEKESYRFALHNGTYLLEEAVIGGYTLTLSREDGLYIASENGETAQLYLYGGYSLDRFSIRLLPRSLAEVRRFNTMRAALDSGSDILGWYEDAMNPGTLYSGSGKGNIPVYGAPSEKAWRAGGGKAAVSLKGDLWVLREWIGEDGSVWLHIRYEVSQRTHRFGFIQASQLPGYQVSGCDAYPTISVPVRTAATPAIQTDDPLLSQFSQFDLPAGMELDCIGMYNDEYALVRTAIGSKEAWLFVPLKDLTPVTGEIRWDVMEQLTGCWYFWAGGNMASDYLRFRPDGTFDNPAWPAEGGDFTVTDYDPAQGKYWDNPPYEITLRYADGRVTVKGLSLEKTEDENGVMRDGFGLTNWEGGGGYIRIDESSIPMWESADGNG